MFNADLPPNTPPEILFSQSSIAEVRLEKPVDLNGANSSDKFLFLPNFDHPPKNKLENGLKDELKEEENFFLIPMGINLGDRNVVPSTMVRGLEDGKKAIYFDYWLIPFNDVIQALNYRVTTLDDGQLELRNFASVVRINPDELMRDPELGLCFTPIQIRTLLDVPVEFSIEEYAVILSPVWLGQNADNRPYARENPPISFDGIPRISASNGVLTAVGQNLNISGGGNNDTNYQGNLSAVGSLLGGSLYLDINQRDFSDANTWRINEFQYLNQTPSGDLAIGTQTPFWSLQQGGNFIGVTNIQRWGFVPPETFASLGNGFSPNERLSSDRVGRNIIGEAPPGTLARLVSSQGNFVFAEVLVDSSGIYRFEDIPTSQSSRHGFTGTNNYRVYLYPNGQLTATPEIREANYSTLPGQLTQGSVSLITSLGSTRDIADNQFMGDLDALKGGVSARVGVTDSLTLGAGLVYDENPLGLTEMFYQPANVPLKVSASALLGTEKDGGVDYNANVDFEPTNEIRFNFNSDELSQRLNGSWRLLPGLSLTSSWNSREEAIAGGINLGRNFGDLFTSTSLDMDSNNNLRWNLRSRFKNMELNHRGNEITSSTELVYSLSRQRFWNSSGLALIVNYDTANYTDQEDDLVQGGIRYRPEQNNADGFAPWTFELTYGVGTRGDGVKASASTSMIPGLYLNTSLETVSLTDDETRFTVGISSTAVVNPQLSIGNSRFERLRSEGGLFLVPFYDKNSNGQRDGDEEIYTEEVDLLFLLNNEPISRLGQYEPDVRGEGILFRLAPNLYRLDLDPAGSPIGWTTAQSSLAVEVTAGGYTEVTVPLIPSYTVAGRVSDTLGKPLSGVIVEAVPVEEDGKRVSSITNQAGIYYLEGLEQGKYNLLVDNQIAQPNPLEINHNSESMLELNLGFGDSVTSVTP